MKIFKLLLLVGISFALTACPSKGYSDVEAKSHIEEFNEQGELSPRAQQEAVDNFCRYLREESEAYLNALKSASSRQEAARNCELYMLDFENGAELEKLIYELYDRQALSAPQIEMIKEAEEFKKSRYNMANQIFETLDSDSSSDNGDDVNKSKLK